MPDSPSTYFQRFRREFYQSIRKAVVENVIAIVAIIVVLIIQLKMGWIKTETKWSAVLLNVSPYLTVLAAYVLYHLVRTPQALDKAREQQISSEHERAASHERRATEADVTIGELRNELKEQADTHEAETDKLRASLQKLYERYRAHLMERHDLRGQLALEKTKNASADISGEIKEIYFKWYTDGLHVTMLVLLVNHRKSTTIRDFILRFPLGDTEHKGEPVDVSPFSFVRTRRLDIFRRQETWEPLEEADLRILNNTSLERIHHREGWLRFRMPRMYQEPRSGRFILDVIDATGKAHPIEVSDPWPQTGTIRFMSRFEEESKPKPAKKRRPKSAKQ